MDTNNSCPVTLDDLKKHLRNPPDMLEDTLKLALSAAFDEVKSFTLIDFENDFENAPVPDAIKHAILLKAAYLIDHPCDSVHSLSTCSDRLLTPFVKWSRVKKK